MPDYNPYHPKGVPPPPHLQELENFVTLARAQVGDRYQFGAEADGNPDPDAFDSSELVEWAAHEAGLKDMPDGSWNQYRYLHDRGGAVSFEDAMRTKGALVFGFSSDPLASPDRPARAYVAISMGDGKNVIDVSERAGEVRVMDHGGFYSYGAVIPDWHTLPEPEPSDLDANPYGDDPLGIPGGVGWSRPGHQPSDVAPDPTTDPAPEPDVSRAHGRTIHEQFPGDERYPDGMPAASVADPEDQVCYPDDEPAPEDQVCYPDDDAGDAGDAGFSIYSDAYSDL